jgi:hypothetical protein
MMARMGRVGLLVRVRKARWALVLALVGAPAWLFAAEPPARPPWPSLDGAGEGSAPQPPASQRLWPPPEPPRRPRQPPAESETPDAPAADQSPAAEAPVEPPARASPSPARPDAPATPTPAPAAGQPSGPPNAGPPANPSGQWPPGGVLVDVSSDAPNVRIDQVLPTGGTYPACVAPCHRVLWRNVSYVVQAEGVPPTSAFVLPDSTSRVTLDVHAGSATKRTAGVALMIAGGVAGLIGFAGASSTGTVNADGTTGSSSTHETGLAVLAVGGTAAIIGIVLFTTGRTLVTSSTGATFTEHRQPRPRSPSFIALGALRALTPRGLSF